MSISLKNFGHLISQGFHDFEVAAGKVASWVTKEAPVVEGGIAAVAPIVGAIDPALAPVLTAIDINGKSVLATFLATLAAASEAATADGLNVQYDEATVAEGKALLASLEQMSPGAIGKAAKQAGVVLPTALPTPA